MRRTPKWLVDAGDRIVRPPATDGPSMLYYDIETTPQLAYQWGSGKYDTNSLKVVKPRYVASAVYGWEPPTGEPFEQHWVSLDQNPHFKPDHPWTKTRRGIDNWVTGELWHLFNVADITIAHNGKRFDTKRTNARLLVQGVKPYLMPYQIDTLLEYRKVSSFPSHSLAELARELGLAGKYHHGGLDMWWGCMEGDPFWWAEMKKYNIQDVVTLRDIFLKVQPWTTPVVNATAYLALQSQDRPITCTIPGCPAPTAGSIARGPRPTRAGLIYQRWECKGCGGYSQNRYADRDYSRSSTRRK